MDIIKNKKDENTYELILINDEGNKFIIHYAGGDLYWTMLDYCENNEFVISKNDEILFSQMETIFRQIVVNDDPYVKLLKGNCFEWISEAYGTPDESNKLTILKDNDKFIIKFFQNTKRFCKKDICTICFCLNGSRNRNIANAFSIMFYECIKEANNKTKALIK